MEAYRSKTLVFIFLSLLSTARACAAVLFVIPEYSSSSIALVNKTNKSLAENIDLKTIVDVNPDNIKQYQAVVLVGSTVLNQWTVSGVPTVAVLVSSKQTQQHQRLINTSIYTDPPLARQVLLAIELLGNKQSFGVLFKNSQQAAQYDLDSLGQKFWPKTRVSTYYSEENESIPHALYPLLRDNKALIGIYDNDLYSSENIKTILITAYRQNRPLIGPSAAYLKAGALASTYSNIDDTALRLAQVLQQGLAGKGWADSDYNPYFHVGLNEQVGRSLNLVLPDAETLAKKIRAIEAAYNK